MENHEKALDGQDEPRDIKDMEHVLTTPQAKVKTLRHYVRCADCLTVTVLESKPVTALSCDACGGPVEYMGRVEPTFRSSMRLAKDALKCKCDERCTQARGPKCDCPCEGANHGASLAGFCTVAVDAGSVPRVTPPLNEKKLAALRERVTAWRAEAEDVGGQLRERAKVIRAGRKWLNEEDYYAELRLLDAAAKLRGKRVPLTWSARATALKAGRALLQPS